MIQSAGWWSPCTVQVQVVGVVIQLGGFRVQIHIRWWYKRVARSMGQVVACVAWSASALRAEEGRGPHVLDGGVHVVRAIFGGRHKRHWYGDSR